MLLECRICDEVVNSTSELDLHKRLHDPSDRVVCRTCGHEAATLSLHRTHAQRCFACSVCARRFRSAVRLGVHVCLVNNGKPLLCPCGLEFEKYDLLVAHARGPKPLHCCECNRSCPTLRDLMRHFQKHFVQQLLECAFCPQTFSSKIRLQTHIRTMHLAEQLESKVWTDGCGTIRQQCDECGRSVAAEFLESHQAKHKKSSSLCPDCGKIVSSFRMAQHLQLHNYDPVTCDICLKVLKTKKILAEHLKTHLKTEMGTRVAQAVCPHCGLELAQKGSLQRHIILVHERHRLKKDDRPRVCKLCNLTLPSNAQYYTHMRNHRAALERHPCTICSREFNKKHNLIRHMYLLHNDNKPEKPEYVCEICSKILRDRVSMIRHYRLQHNAELRAREAGQSTDLVITYDVHIATTMGADQAVHLGQ